MGVMIREIGIIVLSLNVWQKYKKQVKREVGLLFRLKKLEVTNKLEVYFTRVTDE